MPAISKTYLAAHSERARMRALLYPSNRYNYIWV